MQIIKIFTAKFVTNVGYYICATPPLLSIFHGLKQFHIVTVDRDIDLFIPTHCSISV